MKVRLSKCSQSSKRRGANFGSRVGYDAPRSLTILGPKLAPRSLTVLPKAGSEVWKVTLKDAKKLPVPDYGHMLRRIVRDADTGVLMQDMYFRAQRSRQEANEALKRRRNIEVEVEIDINEIVEEEPPLGRKRGKSRGSHSIQGGGGPLQFPVD